MAIPISQSRPTPPGIRGWLLAPEPKGTLHASVQQFYQGWLKFREHPLGVVGLVVILILIITAAAAPLLTQYDPIAQNMAIRLSPPLGTTFSEPTISVATSSPASFTAHARRSTSSSS